MNQHGKQTAENMINYLKIPRNVCCYCYLSAPLFSEGFMKDFLTVSEIGKLFGLGVQTLHYYDTIDLFKPVVRDSHTGYRKYKFDQIYQLASIRYLRKMGYSLDDVRKFLNSRNTLDTIGLLKERSLILHKQWEVLMQIDSAIQRKIQYIEHKCATLDLDSIEVRWFPERRYIPIGSEEHLYMEDSFYFYPTIAFYEGKDKYFGAYFDVSMDGISGDFNGIDPQATSVITSGNYLVGYHKGPYEKIEERFLQMQEAYSALHLSGLVINFNIIDQFIEQNSSDYITEIQMKIMDDQPGK